MSKFFRFWEAVDGYEIPVFNEREVRAAAWILFAFALFTFLRARYLGDFFPTRLFAAAFLVDFAIRLFVNPKYAPSIVLARMVVGWQKPEYVGAPQKRFAWGIGFVLAAFMTYATSVADGVTPGICLICVACLVFLFFESAFGICIGCKLYDWVHPTKRSKYCPGGSCELGPRKENVQKIDPWQIITLVVFFWAVYAIGASWLVGIPGKTAAAPISAQAAPNSRAASDPYADCEYPSWAKTLGCDKATYVSRHGCKKPSDK